MLYYLYIDQRKKPKAKPKEKIKRKNLKAKIQTPPEQCLIKFHIRLMRFPPTIPYLQVVLTDMVLQENFHSFCYLFIQSISDSQSVCHILCYSVNLSVLLSVCWPVSWSVNQSVSHSFSQQFCPVVCRLPGQLSSYLVFWLYECWSF